jgi:hypothetical protein
MPLQSTRAVQDALLSVTANYNVAGATTSTNGIDLGQAAIFPVNERVMVILSTTIATGANNKNVNIALQHSNVNLAANFVNVAVGSLATIGIIGETNGNYIATQWNISLPPDTKQFIRAKANTEASGGAANDGTYTLRVVF